MTYPKGVLRLFAAVGVLLACGAAAGQPTAPRPAVARIVVQEGDGTAYGSGALVDARGEYGLVVTNWHVVRDATGPIDVLFPSGFRSQARPLKLDEDWDLAALVIWRPPTAPFPIASRAPRPGEPLTICGYGSGQYREATGRCTDYYAPEIGLPHELVELSVEARQGDSGGPILNGSGEIAGVLFGAGQGTTLGSFGGRVGQFLASLAPDIGTPRSTLDSLDPRPAAPPALAAVAPIRRLPPVDDAAAPVEVPLRAEWSAVSVHAQAEPADLVADAPSGPEPSSPADTPTLSVDASPTGVTAAAPALPGWFDQAKTLFAVIGVVFVLMQIVRVVT